MISNRISIDQEHSIVINHPILMFLFQIINSIIDFTNYYSIMNSTIELDSSFDLNYLNNLDK